MKNQAKVELTDWNIQDYLKTPEQIAGYLQASVEEARETKDIGFVVDALGDVAHAMGLGQFATFFAGVAAGVKAMSDRAPRTARRKTAKRAVAIA